MLYNWFIATKASEVGQSWFDFFSIGHICFGIGAFILLSLFYSIPKAKGYTPIFSLLMVFICTVVILVIWEVGENLIVFWLGWGDLRFGGRPDSLQNMTTDLLLGIIGALIACIYAYLAFEKDKKIWEYYLFGIINLCIWIGIFVIFLFLTLA
jgi:uncharacterized membrane protein YeaQ/YmgE (transglycosylase-associated protein family)